MNPEVFRLEAAASQLMETPIPEENTADVAGRVRKVERDLGDWRRGLVSEVGAQDGKAYRVVAARSATRSYNFPAILKSVMDRLDLQPFAAIRSLVDAGALRLSFQWSRLEQYFYTHAIDLRKQRGEVDEAGDADGPHVGEVWGERLNIEGVTDE